MGMEYWKAAKKVMRYLQGTKDCMLTYRNLEVIGYLDFDLAGCVNTRKSIMDYVFLLAKGEILWRSVK